jgi:hypothetical protein
MMFCLFLIPSQSSVSYMLQQSHDFMTEDFMFAIMCDFNVIKICNMIGPNDKL